MKCEFYSDNRDLIKWGGIVQLCKTTGIKNVLHVAYFRDSSWPQINYDGNISQIPDPVLQHFRDIHDIKRLGITAGLNINVIDDTFVQTKRSNYTEAISKRVINQHERLLVFLDPDTGIIENHAKEEHVRPEEARLIWQSLKKGDYLVLYQLVFEIPTG
jgi:hypothetical protein